MDDAGNFVIAHTHQWSSSDLDARAQVFDDQGAAQGDSFWISGEGRHDEFAPTGALGDDGQFVAAFGTYGQKQQPGEFPEGRGVSARRFSL